MVHHTAISPLPSVATRVGALEQRAGTRLAKASSARNPSPDCYVNLFGKTGKELRVKPPIVQPVHLFQFDVPLRLSSKGFHPTGNAGRQRTIMYLGLKQTSQRRDITIT